MRYNTTIFTILIASIVILFSCNNNTEFKPANLTKVSPEEVLEMTRNFEYIMPKDLKFRNEKGEEVNFDSLLKVIDSDDYSPTYYKNEEGKVVEAVLKPKTEADREFWKEYKRIIEDPEIKTVEINCDDKEVFLQEIHDIDQGMRTGNIPWSFKLGHENLEKVLSFIEKCGMPTREEVSDEPFSAIWLVIQHSNAKWQKKYISLFEASASKGDMEWGSIALMRDRILLNDGKPQIYGSQMREGKLYDLENPEYVDKRRKEMGLEPLKNYLARFNIEFDVPQKE